MGYHPGPDLPPTRVFIGADPAAGAEALVTVPAGATWILHSFRIPFAASAAVVNRLVRLEVDDGATILLDASDSAFILAGENWVLTFANYGAPQRIPATGRAQFCLPPGLKLLPGYRLRTVTIGLDVADNFGAPVVFVEQYP